jgi:transcriptional regulator with XRE-family HTH domain
MITSFEKSTIKDLRLLKGMTQLEFARLVGTSRQVLAMWENGDGMPSMESLIRVSNATGTPISHFFNESEPCVHHTEQQGGHE